MIDIHDIEKKLEIAEGAEKTSLRLDLAYFTRIIDPKRSSREALKAYHEAVELKDIQLELQALNNICTAALYDAEFQNADAWIAKLAERGIETANNPAIGRSYIFKYRWSSRSGKLTEAAQYLNNALEFFDLNKHKKDITNCYTGLGNIHFKLKNYDKAYDYYNQALKLSDENPQVYLIIKQNIGSIHIIRQEYLKAWDVYHSVLDEVDDNDFATKRIVYENLGHICQKTGELQEALDYFEQSLEFSKSADAETNLIRPLINKAHTLLLLKRKEESLKVFENARDIAEKSENPVSMNEAYQGLIFYYKEFNDLEKIVEFQDKLLEVKDNLVKSSTLDKINQFEIEHQINIYKEKSKLLNEKNILISEQNKTLKDTMNSLVTKNKDLEIKLKNAFSTIHEKDSMLTANHRMASIGEMISIVAHQWKQPLSIINALIYTIKDAYTYNELTEKLLFEKAEMINELVDYLSQTINDFRFFFKKQDYIDFKVSSALQKTLDLLDYALEKENITIIKEYNLDFLLNGSPNELTQVFLNLINNARDAFKEEKTENPVINISLSENELFFLLDIYDNGGTIPDSIADNLFDAYVSSKGDNGTGLGLNICKTIIEEHFHGKIDYKNSNNGVVFQLKFPKIITD